MKNLSCSTLHLNIYRPQWSPDVRGCRCNKWVRQDGTHCKEYTTRRTCHWRGWRTGRRRGKYCWDGGEYLGGAMRKNSNGKRESWSDKKWHHYLWKELWRNGSGAWPQQCSYVWWVLLNQSFPFNSFPLAARLSLHTLQLSVLVMPFITESCLSDSQNVSTNCRKLARQFLHRWPNLNPNRERHSSWYANMGRCTCGRKIPERIHC